MVKEQGKEQVSVSADTGASVETTSDPQQKLVPLPSSRRSDLPEMTAADVRFW